VLDNGKTIRLDALAAVDAVAFKYKPHADASSSKP
jgi:hypothetical protein